MPDCTAPTLKSANLDLDRAIYRGRLRLALLDRLKADASRTLAEVLHLQRQRLLLREGGGQ
jgi:hypothetical protein